MAMPCERFACAPGSREDPGKGHRAHGRRVRFPSARKSDVNCRKPTPTHPPDGARSSSKKSPAPTAARTPRPSRGSCLEVCVGFKEFLQRFRTPSENDVLHDVVAHLLEVIP